jgi:hypothetical protein
MGYDPRVIRAIQRIGRKRHEPGRYIVGELATGIVESGLRNLPGGDADSYGFRQQRESGYGRQSLSKQINNLYDEFHQYDKGQALGNLIADVQRPAAQYRGRYAQVLDQARKLAGGHIDPNETGGGVGSSQVSSQPSESSGSPNIFATLGALQLPYSQDNPNQQMLQQGWNMLAALQDRKAGASAPSSVEPASTGGGADAPASANGSPLYELFYKQDAWKNGQPIGAIPGHDDHLHAAANQRRIRYIARQAQKQGLSVRELGGFDPVDPVHAKNSYHYKNEAADIGGSPQQLSSFERWLRRRYF